MFKIEVTKKIKPKPPIVMNKPPLCCTLPMELKAVANSSLYYGELKYFQCKKCGNWTCMKI